MDEEERGSDLRVGGVADGADFVGAGDGRRGRHAVPGRVRVAQWWRPRRAEGESASIGALLANGAEVGVAAEADGVQLMKLPAASPIRWCRWLR